MNNKKKLDSILELEMPASIENLQLPDPTLLQFYRNYENRILWLGEEVTEYSLEYAKMIMQWNFEDIGVPVEERKPIKMLFFSPGGDLEVNNSLIDTIQLSKTKIIGINVGLAASSGCFIYLSCHERLTFPNAQFLLHKGSGCFSGEYNNAVAWIMNYQRLMSVLEDFVLERTHIPKELFDDNFENDWYLSADDAIKYGIADRFIENLEEIF